MQMPVWEEASAERTGALALPHDEQEVRWKVSASLISEQPGCTWVQLLAIDTASTLRRYTPPLLTRQDCIAPWGLSCGLVQSHNEEKERNHEW